MLFLLSISPAFLVEKVWVDFFLRILARTRTSKNISLYDLSTVRYQHLELSKDFSNFLLICTCLFFVSSIFHGKLKKCFLLYSNQSGPSPSILFLKKKASAFFPQRLFADGKSFRFFGSLRVCLQILSYTFMEDS